MSAEANVGRLRVVGAREVTPLLLYSQWRDSEGHWVRLVVEPGGSIFWFHQDRARSVSASGKDGGPNLSPLTSEGQGKVLLERYRNYLRDLPSTLAPGRLKGQWQGRVRWDGARPVVSLQRDLTTYTQINVTGSIGTASWSWRVNPGKRGDQWFTRIRGEGTSKSLAAALHDSIAACLDLSVGPSCTKRDSERAPKRAP